MLVVSGPSGAGKTSIVKGLLRLRPEIVLSLSATTRAPRPEERDGIDYHFVTPGEFDRMKAAGEFLESATVHRERYGTPKAPVAEALGAGKTVVLEIDVQGAREAKAAVPRAVLVLVVPPSWEVLEERLRARGTESPEQFAARLAEARRELEAAPEFDFRLVNDDLDDAVDGLIRILESHQKPPAPAEAPQGEPR